MMLTVPAGIYEVYVLIHTLTSPYRYGTVKNRDDADT